MDLPSLETFNQTWNLQLQRRKESHVTLVGILELCNLSGPIKQLLAGKLLAIDVDVKQAVTSFLQTLYTDLLCPGTPSW